MLLGMLLFSFCGILASSSRADTLVLQQGVNGYVGCTDTHVRGDGYENDIDTNYGNSSTLLLLTEHYRPS
jgi:hypothetical protein